MLLLLSLLIVSVSLSAEIYKWTDVNGKIHFSDIKPSNKKSNTVNVEINTYKSASFEIQDNKTVTKKVGGKKTTARKKVIMYSTSWCGYCKKAKKYFKKNKISFSERNIETSKKARRQYDKIGGTGVPVIFVDRKRMNGFSEKGFQRIYR